MTEIKLIINGASTSFTPESGESLLHLLRRAGMHSVRYGCGSEQCGACTVLKDGNPVTTCTTDAAQCDGQSIDTLEGLGGEHPVQQALVELNAGQCGYCLSGIIMTAAALLSRNPSPSRADIQVALDGHLCRCGAHNRIIAAVQQAAHHVS